MTLKDIVRWIGAEPYRLTGFFLLVAFAIIGWMGPKTPEEKHQDLIKKCQWFAVAPHCTIKHDPDTMMCLREGYVHYRNYNKHKYLKFDTCAFLPEIHAKLKEKAERLKAEELEKQQNLRPDWP